MRLSRSNYTGPKNVDSGGTPASDEKQVEALTAANDAAVPVTIARHPDVALERPAWENHFYMAPNVRFTRTPDAARKSTGYQPDDVPASPPGSTGVSPASKPRMNQQPACPDDPNPPSAARIAPAAQAGAAARSAPLRRWANLSDHAFFELIGPKLDVPAVPMRRPVPAAIGDSSTTLQNNPPSNVAAHAPSSGNAMPAARQAADITSLYRVIEYQKTERPVAHEFSVSPKSEHVSDGHVTIPRELAAQGSVLMDRAVLHHHDPVSNSDNYQLPSAEFLQHVPGDQGFYMSQEQLEQKADLLESVLEDFGVRGEIIHVRPGPVVTLYEFEPAPGVKSSRVINLSDDIARSMSAISARVAVIPGRNVIGIELPNETRETVYFRELVESTGYRNSSCKLGLCLGKTIGGEPVIAELAKMPHLLVAGTTGSGKSVAINTMILSLLYRLRPDECRLIMVDPKMLELSVYDGIPHLLTPVVTDSKKAVTALKWAVREMEDRYRKMAKLGVRNIDGYNTRAAVARERNEVIVMQVQTGFEKGTGQPVFEEQEIDLSPMPYIVVIVDEMADLMMVAGKEIEGAIQRLAQMARAAGIHLIMATQRPSVDVITGTIKANFPTRISFQVTSKIDSRTILGEQGAEQLLGQGDMLHTTGGGRVSRVHGPFVSDEEVERVVAHLKAQGQPDYLDIVTTEEEAAPSTEHDTPVFDKSALAEEDNGDALFEEAVKIVMRDKKCSTSYIQRRLGVGYNRAASIVERMEQEGLVGAPNHVGKREILAG
ncbi:DNA translocase FtsK [Mesorhizobium sp. CAU 1741]|uniref:DNA translocase FtsK n=1 Tax=Mesorhizobium sp. CAU 1741 TaxID=3140366 RepID=UPI00325A690A